MQNVENLLQGVGLPYFYKVRYGICRDEIGDIKAAVNAALQRAGTIDSIEPGASVAITAGSREINHIDTIIRTLIEALKQKGAQPFIIPAMGSHGGSTAEGQKEMIAQLGITEDAMGVPVLSCMETVKVGETNDGIPVYADKHALSADCIIPSGASSRIRTSKVHSKAVL